jgi:hypothetical protein
MHKNKDMPASYCTIASSRSYSFHRIINRYIQFRGLGVFYFLILLGVFLAYSSLGAGSNERTPLGAHQ